MSSNSPKAAELIQIAKGVSPTGDTGLFAPKANDDTHVFVVKLKDGKELRYKTAYELGYIVATTGVEFENPYDPSTFEYDEYFEGRAGGRDKVKQSSPPQKNNA